MNEISITPYLIEILATLIITLIGVLGTWLTLKISKNAEISSIAKATDQVITAAQQTVGELQQTTVEALKASSINGKLTTEQVETLKTALLIKTKEKLSSPVINLLEATKTDINAIIRGAGEALISQMK